LEEEEAGADLEEEEEAAGLEVGLYDSTSDCDAGTIKIGD
jgi:hypothetical protein